MTAVTSAVRRLAPVGLIAALAGCEVFTSAPEGFNDRLRAEVERNQTNWNNANIRDYDFNFLRTCLGTTCTTVQMTAPVRVQVRNKNVVRALDAQMNVVPPPAGMSWPTMDSLFAVVRRSLQNPRLEVELTFDTLRYFPIFLRVEEPGRERLRYYVEQLDAQPASSPALSPLVSGRWQAATGVVLPSAPRPRSKAGTTRIR